LIAAVRSASTSAMYVGRKTLVFVLLSIGAGSVLWMSAIYFRRKRRQRTAAITNNDVQSTQNEEKPRGTTRRIPGKNDPI